jgi:lipoprotein-anchoring transpeptidase ErfK/SrfK
MRQLWAFVFFLAFLATNACASPGLVARVDLSEQTMTVYQDGVLTYSWKVSTARPGYRTPVGTYRPISLYKMWYSSKYDNSPMPHSIFFRGGYAIHGTYYIKSLGRPVSHGCIRLHPDNARALYNLVLAYGRSDTRIVVVN